MGITREQIANACEVVAAKCEGPNPPTLGIMWPFNVSGVPCCAFGHVLAEAGVPSDIINHSGVELILQDDLGIPIKTTEDVELEMANDRSGDAERSRAVIQPLRNLARALRSAQ